MSRTTSRITFFVLACLTLFAFADEARACSCVERGTPPCAAYWQADAVFAGVVTDIRKLPDDRPNSLPMALLRFRVEDAYRGINVAELDVATLSGTSCDIGFEKGERWLVYAYRAEGTGRLVAAPCSRTHRLQGDSEDLAYIRGLKQGKPEQVVLGKLLRGRYEPLAGLKVTVHGGGRSFESMTDAEGDYRFSLPKAGAYTVRAVIPFSADAMSHSVPVKADATDEQTVIEYDVTAPAGQCVYHEIDVYKVDLHATAEVGGKVLDETGQPITRGYVHLLRAAPKEGSERYFNNARINLDGGFKFEGVAVGNYLLVLNPRDEAPDDSDAPYPRTYYPGVSDESQATPLVVTEGAKLEDINIRVRGPMRKRTVSGEVVWPDGKAAPGASVSVYAGQRSVRSVKAVDGRFEVDVYGDFDYQLKATVFGEKYAQSETLKVPSADPPAPLKLVVKPRS